MKAIGELLKRPVAYQPILAKAFGSVKLALLWSQIYYWSDKTKNKEGWVYKTREDLFEETGLSRKEQETARDLGIELGVLESKRMGQPCTVHFRVDLDKTIDIIESYQQKKPVAKTKVLALPKPDEPTDAQVKQVFEVFYKTVNPNINYGNKTSRGAAAFLIKKYGLQETINMAAYAVSVFGDRYAPTITTPYELKEKMAALAKHKLGRATEGKGKNYDE